MYASIKPWINVPFKIRPFVKRNGAGTKIFAPDIDALCYPKEDVKLVVDKDGAEVVSTTELYVDGTVDIKVTDDVVFEGAQKPIKRLGSFYRDGRVDIRVVYI